MAETLFLERSNPVACAYLPYAVNRIMDFSHRYVTEELPQEQGEIVWRMFGAGDPRLGLWVAIKDYRVVAHLYATPDPLDAPPGRYTSLLIRQAEVDRGHDLRAEAKAVFAECQKWAQKFGLTRFLMLTHRRADLMARRWGFQPYKTVMELILPQGKES